MTLGERLTGGAAAAVLVAGLVVATAWDERVTPVVVGGPATVQNARPVDRAGAVRQLLAVRAEAVLAHDAAAFLSTLDPTVPGLRAREAAWFADLRGVPLAEWSYDLDPSREPEGDRWSPQVTLRYALAGFDREPTAREQRVTFVLRDGEWLVADAASSPPDLWEAGPVVVRRGTACLVLSHPRRAALAQQVQRDCDAAVPRVTAVWGRGWAQRVVVLVPDDLAELGRLVPEAGDLSQIAALATAELLTPGRRYHPVGDRVVVNPQAYRRLTAAGRRVVMTHEVTHVASRGATGPQVPTWLVEGLADHVGFLGAGIPVGAAAAELRAAVRAGSVPRALPSDRAFTVGRDDLAEVYEQSWLAVRMVAGRWGTPRLLALYRETGAGTPFPRALEDVLGVTPAQLVGLWQQYLRQQLR